MKTKNIYLKDLHFEHKIWRNELKFVKDEISIYESRLGDIVSKILEKEMLVKVEHFQNQFIREKEVVDTLLHEINKHEDALESFAEDNPVAIDHHHFRDHGDMRERFDRFRTIYKELKTEYLEFLSECM